MGSNMKDQTTLANWQIQPYSKWAFQHVSDIIRCDTIHSAPGSQNKTTPRPLDLSEFSISDSSGQIYSLEAFHEATATDSFIVQRGGSILHELYLNGSTEQSQHILFSATKSVVGLLLGIMADEGTLEVDAPVSKYVPEVAHTAYAETTLRNLIDMRAGPDVDMYEYGYRTSMRWQPEEEGKPGMPDMETYFAKLNVTASPNGGAFRYASQHTDLLGLAMERASGSTVSRLLSDKIWKPLGAGRDALMTVDAKGLARASGGMCTTLRDFATMGLLMAYGGRTSQDKATKPVVPPTWVEDTLNNGDEEAWKQGGWARMFQSLFPGASYRNGWYVLKHDGGKYVAASGLFGQSLIIDPACGLVVAKTSSQASGFDFKTLLLPFRAFEEIRRIVLKHDNA